MPPFPLSCLAYLSVAVPGSVLGLLWPSMRVSWHQPLGALGVLLIIGVGASVLASVATGRLLSRSRAEPVAGPVGPAGPAGPVGPVGLTGPVVAVGALLPAVALSVEAAAPVLWLFAAGMVVFGLGFGALDSALNAYAATQFGPRQINWMHASYGLGATAGPLLVTALRAGGLGWRGTFAALAVAQGAVALLLTVTWRAWDRRPARPDLPPEPAGAPEPAAAPAPAGLAPAVSVPALAVLAAVTFAAVETGIESGAGIWGYVFLTAGRGVSSGVAAVAMSAYWATMFAGRAIGGPVAERFGPVAVLTGGVAGMIAGAALLTVPAPAALPRAALPIAGLVMIGLAAAPVFPLLTLTTAQRTGARGAPRAVGLQVAASALGNAALPAGIGLIIGTLTAAALGPSLLVLGLILAGLHGALTRRPRCAGPGTGS